MMHTSSPPSLAKPVPDQQVYTLDAELIGGVIARVITVVDAAGPETGILLDVPDDPLTPAQLRDLVASLADLVERINACDVAA